MGLVPLQSHGQRVRGAPVEDAHPLILAATGLPPAIEEAVDLTPQRVQRRQSPTLLDPQRRVVGELHHDPLRRAIDRVGRADLAIDRLDRFADQIFPMQTNVRDLVATHCKIPTP